MPDTVFKTQLLTCADSCVIRLSFMEGKFIWIIRTANTTIKRTLKNADSWTLRTNHTADK